MISERMYGYGATPSCIRQLFEYGKQQAAIVGIENIYDFSLGNPSVPPPAGVKESFLKRLQEQNDLSLHGYTSAPGRIETRQAIADDLNQRYGTNYRFDELFMCCGAAATLTSVIRALTINHQSEFIVLAPFFAEYRCFIDAQGGKSIVVDALRPSFDLNLAGIEAALTPQTQALIINSPNNPCGKIYKAENLKKLAELLERKAAEYGHPIYIISDEPYRELVYEGEVPWLPLIYKDTIVCYSYSKSLSMPGERIGYYLVADSVTDGPKLRAACAGSVRSHGFVCAPSLVQQVIEDCAHLRPDLEPYRKNRRLLYDGMLAAGYECVSPDGAFYLFVKAPGGDAKAFSEHCKTKNVLVVPGNDFGCPDYVRLSYCIAEETIRKALPYLAELRHFGD